MQEKDDGINWARWQRWKRGGCGGSDGLTPWQVLAVCRRSQVWLDLTAAASEWPSADAGLKLIRLMENGWCAVFLAGGGRKKGDNEKHKHKRSRSSHTQHTEAVVSFTSVLKVEAGRSSSSSSSHQSCDFCGLREVERTLWWCTETPPLWVPNERAVNPGNSSSVHIHLTWRWLAVRAVRNLHSLYILSLFPRGD